MPTPVTLGTICTRGPAAMRKAEFLKESLGPQKLRGKYQYAYRNDHKSRAGASQNGQRNTQRFHRCPE